MKRASRKSRRPGLAERTGTFRTILAGSFLFVGGIGQFGGHVLTNAASATIVQDHVFSTAVRLASSSLLVAAFGLLMAYGIARRVERAHRNVTQAVGPWNERPSEPGTYAREIDDFDAAVAAAVRHVGDYASDRNHQLKTLYRRIENTLNEGQRRAAASLLLFAQILSEDLAHKATRVQLDQEAGSMDPALILQEAINGYAEHRITYSGPARTTHIPNATAVDFIGLTNNLLANATSHGEPTMPITAALTHHAHAFTMTITNGTKATTETSRPPVTDRPSVRRGNAGDNDTIRRLNGTIEHRNDVTKRTHTVTVTIPIPPAA